MAYPSEIERQQFNDIKMARIYSYEIGALLKDKLGKLLVEASNYYPIGSNVTAGLVYSVTFEIISAEDKTLIDTVTPTYTALVGDGVLEVLEGLELWIDTGLTTTNLLPAVDYMITNVYTDYSSDQDKHMFFVAKDTYILSENTKGNLESDPNKAWTPSDTPAVYLGYGSAPKAEFPRIVVTPTTQSTVCNLMEESVMLIDEVETEYTSSYLTYGMTLTCEAGDADSVLKTSISAQSVLNDFRVRMTNQIMKMRIQNAMNSVCHPIERITPLPLIEATKYMSIATASATFDCIDVLFPDQLSGFVEQVNIQAGDPQTEEGTLYKYSSETETVIYGDPMVIDRRE